MQFLRRFQRKTLKTRLILEPYERRCLSMAKQAIERQRLYLDNTAQSAFGASWKNCALILSLFLGIHNPIRFAHMYKFA